jgi:predicted phage terminase large subunit-like protein
MGVLMATAEAVEELEQATVDFEKLLNLIDYTRFNSGYVPSRFALKFIAFIKLVNGSMGEENTSPLFHYDMLDTITESRQNLFVCFRGGAKTSVIHEYMFLYIAVYGDVDGFGAVDVAMYVADTIDNGIKSMRQNLQYRWDHSPFMQKYVPYTKFIDSEWEFRNADGKMFFVKGFGANTGVRGFKKYGQRPTWLGLDDLMSDKNAESATIVEDIKKVLYRAARQCLHPKKRMINWTGTPFNKQDPLYEAAESKSWNTKIYPLCEKFPCSEEEFRGAWEDRFPYSFVRHEYESLKESGELAAFDQELMLRITSDEDRLVNDDDLVWYSRKDVLKNKGSYNWYITTDFGTTDGSKSDYSVISVWAYNNNEDWMLVDGMIAQQLMDKTLADLFKFVSMYKPLEVGVETSGQQGAFIAWIKAEMLRKKVYFNLAKGYDSKKEGINPKSKKITRFMQFMPVISAKKLLLPEEMKTSKYMVELLEELRFVTKKGFKSKHDDVADTLSMLTELDPFAPSEVTHTEYIQSEDGTYAVFPDDDDLDSESNSTVF